MLTFKSFSEYGECRALWEKFVPREVITDLWEIRDCFHREFRRELFFLTAEDNGETVGFLPLCYIPESGSFGFFPGESWHGKTWLEQNRLTVKNRDILNAMLDHIKDMGKGGFHIRYLISDEKLHGNIEDETGYLFSPPLYGFSMDEYYKTFSGKTAKRIKKEVAAIEERSSVTISDDISCFDILADMNVSRFGNDSYFSDTSFRNGFKNMAELLRKNGMLRMTTVTIDKRYAAVDMGSIYKNVYTLLAGGTSADFQGVAKFINTLHMRFACEQKIAEADFLCGNFSWKSMFHLEPRPLFKVSNVDESVFEKPTERKNGACIA